MHEIPRLGLVFGPASVGDCSMAGTGHRAEVPESGLTWRPAIVHRHIPLGVVKIHVRAEAGAEGEDVGDLSSSNRGPKPLRYLIAVDRGYLGRIQHRQDPHLTSRAAQELHQLMEGERGAVFGPHQRVTGTQRGLGEVEVEYNPGSRRRRIKPRRHLSDNDR